MIDNEMSENEAVTSEDISSPCPALTEENPVEPIQTKASDIQEPQIEVVGIRFKKSGKAYYFAPNGIELQKETHVIVETSRGLEYGICAITARTVPVHEIVPPLRPVVRLATDSDEEHYLANQAKETEAFNICLSRIEQTKLDMKLVECEYTFDNSKLLFYFTADGRIDFRELVKYLASVFRTRIEMRQIGIRDETKMMGGLGICGRPYCCKSFLNDFMQVSIKMAKEQNLSLNSSKISGACGRLMCCLRYEYDTYAEEIAKTPKVDSVVTTPDGDGVVIEINPLAGICRVRLLSEPDKAPKYFSRDDITFKGIYRKDLPPTPISRPTDNAQNARNDRRINRRTDKIRPKPEKREHVYPENDIPAKTAATPSENAGKLTDAAQPVGSERK